METADAKIWHQTLASGRVIILDNPNGTKSLFLPPGEGPFSPFLLAALRLHHGLRTPTAGFADIPWGIHGKDPRDQALSPQSARSLTRRYMQLFDLKGSMQKETSVLAFTPGPRPEVGQQFADALRGEHYWTYASPYRMVNPRSGRAARYSSGVPREVETQVFVARKDKTSEPCRWFLFNLVTGMAAECQNVMFGLPPFSPERPSTQTGSRIPVFCSAYIWLMYTAEGDYVVDLCAGDGGSAVSAMCLGRNCILSDLNLDTLVTCIQFLHDHAHELLLQHPLNILHERERLVIDRAGQLGVNVETKAPPSKFAKTTVFAELSSALCFVPPLELLPQPSLLPKKATACEVLGAFRFPSEGVRGVEERLGVLDSYVLAAPDDSVLAQCISNAIATVSLARTTMWKYPVDIANLIEVRPCSDHRTACGLGVYALSDISFQRFSPNNLCMEPLGAYLGIIYRCNISSVPQTNYLFTLIGSPGRDEADVVVDAGAVGNWTRYINHCCRPRHNLDALRVLLRCGARWEMAIAFFPTRDICAGEELTFPYADRKEDLFFDKCFCAKCQRHA